VTAHDLVRLAEATIYETPSLYRQFYGTRSFTWGKTMGGDAIKQDNRNPILGRISGADGLKTGHTQEAGYGFTGSAEQGGRRLVMVVAGLGSFNDRIEESVRFMDWGFKAWKGRRLFRKDSMVETAEVQLGSASSVPLVAPRDLAVTLPLSASGDITVKVVYNGPIKAPIAKGQEIAQLIVSTADTDPQIMPLVAGEAVAEAGFFGRLWNGLADNPGKFITLEGGEGVGKSTQVRLLAAYLRGRGLEVIETREPGGTAGAEAIRELLLGGKADRWNPRAEALLFAAARSDHVERLIRPAIERGAWVVCDRYIDSNRAYQAGASGLADDDILTAHRIGSQGLMPDRTLLLTLPLDIAAQRASIRDGGKADRFGARDRAFHDRVAAAFLRYAQQEPMRIRQVDAANTPEAVNRQIVEALSDLLP
jgi:dTMP kinase